MFSKSGHRRRTGEPKDQDRADVVNGAEHLAQICDVRETPARALRLSALLKLGSGYQHGRDQAAADQEEAHYRAAALSSIFRVFSIRFGLSTSGITATPVSNPERPSASFGNTSSDSPMIISKTASSVPPFAGRDEQGVLPIRYNRLGSSSDLVKPGRDDDQIQQQIGNDQ